MGMKIAVRNAREKLSRSDRTANTSPRAVTVAGTTATQMTLLRMARRVRALVNSSW